MASRALDKLEESSFIEVWVPGQSERVDHWVPSNRLLVVLNQIVILGPGLPMVCPGNVTMQILNFWKHQNFLIIKNIKHPQDSAESHSLDSLGSGNSLRTSWGHPEIPWDPDAKDSAQRHSELFRVGRTGPGGVGQITKVSWPLFATQNNEEKHVLPSVSSNFLEFRMFWHVPFQELQVSQRNRHFQQNFQHLFPAPFVTASLWVSLADCASASPMKAVSLAPRMRPSLGCLAASKQHPNNIHIQHPNPKKNPHCEVKLLPCRVSKQLVQLLLWKSWYSKQSSGWSFPDQFTAVSETSMKFGAPISDRQKPRNGMIQFHKWLVQRWITWWSQLSHISHPHICWAHLTPPSNCTFWDGDYLIPPSCYIVLRGLDPHLIWWILSFDGRKPEGWQPQFLIVSFCVHYVLIWRFYSYYLLIG